MQGCKDHLSTASPEAGKGMSFPDEEMPGVTRV